jgi:hypothetical protein
VSLALLGVEPRPQEERREAQAATTEPIEACEPARAGETSAETGYATPEARTGKPTPEASTGKPTPEASTGKPASEARTGKPPSETAAHPGAYAGAAKAPSDPAPSKSAPLRVGRCRGYHRPDETDGGQNDHRFAHHSHYSSSTNAKAACYWSPMK